MLDKLQIVIPLNSWFDCPTSDEFRWRTTRPNGALRERTRPGGEPMPDTNAALKSIFFEALERNDPAARAAYLDGACGDDAVLCRRVEALLAAHDGAGRFLEGDPADTSLITAPETPESTRGVRPGDTSLVGNGHRRTQNRRHNLPDRGHRAGQPLTRIGRGPGHCRPVQPARNPRREVQGHPLQADDDHRPVTWLFGRSAVEPITCVVTRRVE
jgi:hypothetical protein